LGREPADFAPDAPENRLYLDYYAEMGMSDDEARAFYAMTNSVPHSGALWLEGAEMARWIAPAARRLDHDGSPDELSRSASVMVAAITGSLRASLAAARPVPSAAPVETELLPRLAYASLGAGLLDSGLAFP
jgi:hypothetical protein